MLNYVLLFYWSNDLLYGVYDCDVDDVSHFFFLILIRLHIELLNYLQLRS